MTTVNLKIKTDNSQKRATAHVIVFINDGIRTNSDNDDIFYYYETFEEIIRNNAPDFEVLEVDGTDINEFV